MTATVDERAISIVRAYREDPVLFARKILKVEPTPQQCRFLEAIGKPGARVAVRSGHGTGKSSALAMAALWFICTHKDAVVACTAPTAHQLDDVLWKEMRQHIERMPKAWKAMFTVTATKATRTGSTGYIVARTARVEKPDALQGFHAKNLMFLIDEAAGVANVVFEAARGALSTPGARQAMAANPTHLSGYFYDAFHANRDLWTRLQFSCIDSPLVARDYISDMVREYGVDSDMYRYRVLGDFPRFGIFNLITLESVEAAMERTAPPDYQRREPIVLGVDPAWLGTDRSAVMLRQGLTARKLFVGRGLNTDQLATLVARKADEIGPTSIFVDQTGVGAGVLDQLRKTKHPVVGVSFAHSPEDKERFANRRAELWWRVKEWLEIGPVLEHDADLRDDLIAPEYFTTDEGKIQLESKDDMRKRGLASPDLGDALALTFAVPVGRPRPETAAPAPYNPYDWMQRR